jgi:hypothetical protein
MKLMLSVALIVAACAGGTRTCLAQEQQQRVILWAPPPVLGVYSPELELIAADIPGDATADWPSFLPALLQELAVCSRLSTEMLPGAYVLHTVDTPVFNVIVRDDNGWHDPDDNYIGFTFPQHNVIYVVQAGAQHRQLLKHELLHALLAAHGFDGRHGMPVADGMFRRCFPPQAGAAQ